MSKKINYTKELLEKAVSESTSYCGVCRVLGLTHKGGNPSTIKKKIIEFGINCDHFLGQASNKGKSPKTKLNIEDVLVENSGWASSSIRKRLIDEKLKEYKCELCSNTEWLGKPIPLELHHINGVHTDNRLENLQILCPTCHSYIESEKRAQEKERIKKEKIVKQKSTKCPSKEDLIEDFKTLKSFLQVGKKYKVSDNAVRKWCKKYEILEDIKNIKKQP